MIEPEEREAKLPVWAQDKINLLRMRLEEASAERRIWEQKDRTSLCITNAPGEEPIYLPDRELLRFFQQKAPYWVNVRRAGWHGQDRTDGILVSTSHTLVVLPHAANSVYIRSEDDR